MKRMKLWVLAWLAITLLACAVAAGVAALNERLQRNTEWNRRVHVLLTAVERTRAEEGNNAALDSLDSFGAGWTVSYEEQDFWGRMRESFGPSYIPTQD